MHLKFEYGLKNFKYNHVLLNKIFQFQCFKKIVETLSTIGTPLSIEDHIETIRSSLSYKYDPFITFLTS